MKPEIVDNVSEMAERARDWSFSRSVALVPTMGFLHEGHLALVRDAAARAEKVIVSIFVNPLQFGPAEDFSNYPRDLSRDAQLLSEVGAEIVFAPHSRELTPEGMMFTVDPGPAGNVLCGRYRPGHFAGVSTIVTKLFQIVRPGMAVFGWKDAQQFLLLKKMVSDLNISVGLHAIETTRETDGLAMSSRNVYLNEAQRKAAPAIYRGLCEVKAAYQNGVSDTQHLVRDFFQSLQTEPLLNIQYAEAVTMDKLEAVNEVQQGNTLFAVAVCLGETRLIDNIRL